MSTKPKLAVVTGSSGAIGNAICRALMNAGNRCLGLDLVDRDNGGWDFARCDITDLDDLHGQFDRIESELGGADILVNSAGITCNRNFLAIRPEDYDAVMGINARGLFFASQEFAKRAIAADRPGVIVQIASVGAFIPTNDAPYGMTKAAVVSLTKTMAKQLAQQKIRVNGVAPGMVRTPMGDSLPPEVQARNMAAVPFGRPAEASEIADAVVFLTTDASRYITGTTVHVNGGMY